MWLRRVAVADARALFAAANDPDVMRYMDWPMPRDASQTAAHLTEAVKSWDGRAEFQWVILVAQSQHVVGTISCRPKDYSADFGYFVGRPHWGKGFAVESASLVLQWLWSQQEIVRIWATADAENVRSRGLLERLGFKLEGILRMATYRPNIGGSPRDTVLYARCRGDS